MARLLLGVSGGIAAYKAIELARLAIKAGHAVRVIQTEASTRFVGTASFAGITGAPVLVTDWEPDPLRGAYPGDEIPAHAPIGHLELVERADAFLIAPASANTIAKLAAGLADGLLGSAYLAFDGPVVIAPAMNTRMWTHPATTRNLGLLAERGVQVVEPASGLLADGEVGMGRLAEPAEIAAAVEARLAGAGTLAGLRVLVSAGGTREPIDPVRYVGNRSSGRMGWAVAEAARRRGADVTVLASNVDLPRHPDVRYVDAPTAADLRRAALDAFGSCDVLVMAAAVADFAPAAARQGKIDKGAEGRLALELEPTADILTELAGRRDCQVVVGFAAEHGAEGLARARAKRERKRLDLIVHNDVSVEGIGFGSADNAVTIIGADGETTLPRMSKDACAERILDAVVSLLPPGLGTESSPER
jgi:phosphopantothenoylcysteine decarboxylase / phosphopantothenate---cysteine ligase